MSVRVPKELKMKMSRVEEDWASYLRRMIERRVNQEQILEASKKIDRIRSKTKEGAYHAAKSVREDRDRM